MSLARRHDHHHDDVPSMTVCQPSAAHVSEQTIGNPQWIQLLQQILDIGGNNGSSLPSNTIFLSPVWSSPFVGVPYFTDLQAALDYVAAQDPQPESPWTIVIYPGLYRDGVPRSRRKSDLVQTNMFIKESHYLMIDHKCAPMCSRAMLRRLNDLRRQALRDWDDAMHEAKQTSMGQVLPSCGLADNDPIELGCDSNPTSPGASHSNASDAYHLPQDQAMVTQSPPLDNDIHPMAQKTLPANVILHAIAKYTVVIGEDMVLNNLNKPAQSSIAFENIVLLGRFIYERQSINTQFDIRFDNCDFVYTNGSVIPGVTFINNDNSNFAERLQMRDCSFFQSTSLQLLMSGLDAKLRSCVFQGAELIIGGTIAGQDQPIASIDAVDSPSCNISVRGSGIIILAGSLPGTNLLVSEDASVRFNNVFLNQIRLINSATASGQVYVQSINLENTSFATISGKVRFIQTDINSRLDLNGDQAVISNGSRCNPTWRIITTTVPSSWSNPRTLSFGNFYANGNYLAWLGCRAPASASSTEFSLQITQRNQNTLQFTALPVVNDSLIVWVLIYWPPGPF